MKLPSMRFADGISKSKQVKFGGLNHTAGAGDGELWDMRNMTSDHYPLLASRPGRRLYRKLNAPGGLFSWEGLCWVDGTSFVFGGVEKGKVTAGRKHFTAIGAYILIFPDKCYYNTESGVFGSMEAKWIGGSLTFSDGVLYGEPAEANCLSCPGVKWDAYFRSGDAVTISGCTAKAGNNLSLIIRAMDGDKLYFYEHSFTLGADGGAYTEQGNLSVARTVPDMDFVCEHENRCGAARATPFMPVSWVTSSTGMYMTAWIRMHGRSIPALQVNLPAAFRTGDMPPSLRRTISTRSMAPYLPISR